MRAGRPHGSLRAMPHLPFPSPRATLVALAAAGLLAIPGVAQAATVSSDGTTATMTGSDAAEIVDVHFWEGAIALSGSVTAGPGCTADELGGGVTCPGGSGGIVANMNGGDDKIHSYLADAPAARYGRYDLGAGNDFAEGYGSEVVNGGAGNDELDGLDGDDVLDGGDGNDKVNGGLGADTLRGGAGDDAFTSDPMDSRSPDVIDGGPGRDSITDWMRGDPATEQLVTVTLDGVADDGFPGEGDNVTNMELVESYGALRFVGTDGDDVARASEVGNRADLTGKGGNDTLKGSDDDDVLDGGPGADDLTAGFGNDTIVGGAGPDKIVADRDGRCNELHCDLSPGSAADTIDAVDGEVDTISCGPGTDTVKADPADVVAPDCETVTRAGAPAPQGQNGKPSTNATTKPKSTRKALAVAGHPSLRALLKRGLTVTVAGRAPGAKVTVKVKRGATVVATGTGQASAAGTAKVTVKVTKAGRRALRRAKRVKLTLVAGNDHITFTVKR
jgi:Ca2+-binding RTX toxin-like protein